MKKTICLITFIFISCNTNQRSDQMIKIERGNLIESKTTIHFIIYTESENQYEIEYFTDLSKSYPGLIVTDIINNENNSVVIESMKDIQNTFPIVPIDSIGYFSKGVPESDYSKLYLINNALHIALTYDPFSNMQIYQQFLEYLYAISISTHGYIWDDESRLLYSQEYWKENIVTSFHDNYADIQNHISIHQYQVDTTVRSITLGLRKFGLPDLVIQSSPRSHSTQNGNILALLGQYLLENPELVIDGSILLKTEDIKNNFVKDRINEDNLPNAKGEGKILLEEGLWEDGDPQNRLWSVFFMDYSKEKIYENQSDFYSNFFGSSDEIIEIKHHNDILLASEEAKTQFNKLYGLFNNGMKPGEYILVKAPFTTLTDTNEWMWVEITEWSKKAITGILQNDPFEVPNLKAGSIVEVDQDSIFDYIYYKEDGTFEGNETGKFIEEMNKL